MDQPEVPNPDRLTKAIVKEALKEWLDEKFLSFGKWTAAGIAASALVAVIFFIFWVELKK